MANTQMQLQKIGDYTPEELQVIQETIAPGTSPMQFNLYMRTAVASGLNPFLGHIHAAVYKEKMNIQYSVDGILYLAKRTEGYRGYDVQLVHENDEFKARKVNTERDGQQISFWVIDKHEISFPRGKVIGCYAIAFRGGYEPFTWFMEVDEVSHFKLSQIGMQKTMWTNFFNDMFKKHVVKRALKGQFGIEINEDSPVVGSYEDLPSYQQQPKDITAEVEAMNIIMPEQLKQPQVNVNKEQVEIDNCKSEMNKKFKVLGIVGKEAKGKFIEDNCKITGDSPTLAELRGILKIMDMHIDDMQAIIELNDDDLFIGE